MQPEPRIEEVTTLAALEQLASEWEQLWRAAPQATPFQSPAWLLPWWRHIGEGELLTLAFRDGPTLVGLLPFYVYEAAEGTRSLFPLGIGTTDYLDGIVLPGCGRPVLEAAARHLAARAHRFALADWPQLRDDATLRHFPAPRGWAHAATPAESCAVLDLPVSMEALGTVMSHKTLRDLRTARRRAADAGVARWEVATQDSLGEIFAALVELHALRWQQRGEAGVLADPRVQAMHRAALPLLLDAGILYLLALRDEARGVRAVLYALADPPRAGRGLYLYISGFDPCLERISPGMLLVGQAIEHAFAAGMTRIDFLRGGERYKSFWGAQERMTMRRRLAPRVEDARCPAAC